MSITRLREISRHIQSQNTITLQDTGELGNAAGKHMSASERQVIAALVAQVENGTLDVLGAPAERQRTKNSLVVLAGASSKRLETFKDELAWTIFRPFIMLGAHPLVPNGRFLPAALLTVALLPVTAVAGSIIGAVAALGD